MDDLISRNEVKERLLDYTDSVDSTRTLSMVVRKIVENVQAVNAAPVVHGRWVDEDYPYKDANANPRVTAICSNCGNIAHRMEHGYSILSKYCPNCGAKMDGERKLAFADRRGAEYADNPTV